MLWTRTDNSRRDCGQFPWSGLVLWHCAAASAATSPPHVLRTSQWADRHGWRQREGTRPHLVRTRLVGCDGGMGAALGAAGSAASLVGPNRAVEPALHTLGKSLPGWLSPGELPHRTAQPPP